MYHYDTLSEKISDNGNINELQNSTLKEKIPINDNINEIQNPTLSQKICTNDNINKLAEKYVIKRSKGKREGFGNPNYLKINERFKSPIDNQQLMEIDTTKSFKLNVGNENLEICIIDFKMIKNIDELINYLSRIYLQKYPNSLLPQLD